jgi:hypothetical protein
MPLTPCWWTYFCKRTRKRLTEIVLDIDTTDFAIHGEQEGRFYHGYYDHYCYLPLYVFAGEHVLCARLRPSNIGPSAGSRKEIERIVKRIRANWPKMKIGLRADSGFCREELMAWCEPTLWIMYSAWRARLCWKGSWPALWSKHVSNGSRHSSPRECFWSSSMRP